MEEAIGSEVATSVAFEPAEHASIGSAAGFVLPAEKASREG